MDKQNITENHDEIVQRQGNESFGTNSLPDGYSGPRASMAFGAYSDHVPDRVAPISNADRVGSIERVILALIFVGKISVLCVGLVLMPFSFFRFFVYDHLIYTYQNLKILFSMKASERNNDRQDL